MKLVVAVRVQHLKVAAFVGSTVGTADNMVQMPPGFSGDLFATHRAFPLLSFPYPRQFPPSLKVFPHLAINAIREIVLMFRQIRIGIRSDFDVWLLVEAAQKQKDFVLVGKSPVSSIQG